MTDPTPIFSSVPRERAEYVGDGLYTCLVAETNTLWLEAYNGVAVSERVALEPEVFAALVRFAARMGWRVRTLKDDRWQPVETAPKDGRQILVAFRGDLVPLWWKLTVFYDNDGGWHGLPPGIMFTHWMDLPADPSGDER